MDRYITLTVFEFERALGEAAPECEDLAADEEVDVYADGQPRGLRGVCGAGGAHWRACPQRVTAGSGLGGGPGVPLRQTGEGGCRS